MTRLREMPPRQRGAAGPKIDNCESLVTPTPDNYLLVAAGIMPGKQLQCCGIIAVVNRCDMCIVCARHGIMVVSVGHQQWAQR